jgi:hypothetical protein
MFVFQVARAGQDDEPACEGIHLQLCPSQLLLPPADSVRLESQSLKMLLLTAPTYSYSILRMKGVPLGKSDYLGSFMKGE